MAWCDLLLVTLLVIPLLILTIGAVRDIAGRPDLQRVSKALWVVALFLSPLIGALVYVVVRPSVVREVSPLKKAGWQPAPLPTVAPEVTRHVPITD
jgi:hypothetical protein